jgi:uncharacterized protein YacL
VGYSVGSILNVPITGVQIGCLAGLTLIFIESRLRRVSVRGLSSMVFGLLLGVMMAKIISNIMTLLPLGTFVLSISEIVLTLVFSYIGAVMALRGKDEFNIIIPYVRFKRQDILDQLILLDTSAIIDGRVSDIHKSGFLAGRLVVPRFVLHELQKLADSADDIKRQRGRRGMELLKAMQNDPKVDVHVHEDDLPVAQTVDERLVVLAKSMDAKICTTDFNLSRTASLQSVDILNIQELASTLKPVIFSGEEIEVKLVKEGKESDQAVAYMDDGTMIVVSNAREFLGQSVRVSVSSIIQTHAGKMVFAKMIR